MQNLTIEADLHWLDQHAFEFSLTTNGHRPGFETVAEKVADGEIADDDWTDAGAKTTAIATNRLILAQVYPNGSVSSYAIYGVDLGAVIASAREHCDAEQSRWRNNGMVPMHERAGEE